MGGKKLEGIENKLMKDDEETSRRRRSHPAKASLHLSVIPLCEPIMHCSTFSSLICPKSTEIPEPSRGQGEIEEEEVLASCRWVMETKHANGEMWERDTDKGGEPAEQVLIGYICVLFFQPPITAAGGAVVMWWLWTAAGHWLCTVWSWGRRRLQQEQAVFKEML